MRIRTLMVFILSLFMVISIPIQIETVQAGSYNGLDLAQAILVNQSALIESSYSDMDNIGHRQGKALIARGTMVPTHGTEFILLSTGIANYNPITTDGTDPGSERGNWFAAGKYGTPRDQATLTLDLLVPEYMHYIYYDVQFYTTEYPEYIGTQYNDQLTITVISPSEGTSVEIIDVNGGDFVLNANDITGSGYDVFAQSGNPDDVDWIETIPNPTGADAGATALTGREHPVSPNEEITIKFEIIDVGDNQFDSAAFIDNLRFSGFAETSIISRKTVKDLNGNYPEPLDILEYKVTISNIGDADQNNNPGYEFEDTLPDNVVYIKDSAQASSGSIAYDSEDKKITWDGAVPAESSIAISFQVEINEGLANGTIVSNQGSVYWDSNEDGTNDAIELTDDPAVDDGVDSDGDGETGDDDPTLVIVSSYETPNTVTEDFSDDTPGQKASQTFEGHTWFETDLESVKSSFEVASNYHYSSSQSFKTKIRADSGIQYWNYSIPEFNSDVVWWQVWFACGNNSEESDLLLDIKNINDNNIAQLKFEYVHEGSDYPSDYVLKLYFKSSSDWIQLKSDFDGGYLYNSWYKIKIEKFGPECINYSLYRAGKGQVDFQTHDVIGSAFSNLTRVEFKSTKNPVVCPMFFWDEHVLGLEVLS